MSSPPSKRQRTGSSALTAPFKSPVPRQERTKEQEKSSALSSVPAPVSGTTETSTPSQATATIQAHAFGTISLSQIKHSSSAAEQQPSLQQRSPTKKGLNTYLTPPPHRNISLALSPASLERDAELRTLQSCATSLTRQLSGVRNALDTAVQAERLERNAARDVELQALITTWTAAARGAAEELLSIAQDKVNAAGGLRAFRARERERVMRRHEGFDDPEESRPVGGGEDDGDEGYGEDGKYADEERLGEWEGVDVDEDELKQARMDMFPPWMRDDDNETSYSMGMLLASLGIDVKSIGYDVKEQRWLD